jgi:predicted transcriptional regulator
MTGTPLGKILKGKVSCSDLLSCLYSLNTAECDLFFSLYGLSELSLDTLARKAGKDRSTVHRILEKLVMAGLCFKDSVSLENGGYRNIYYTLDPAALVEKLEYDVARIEDGLESALGHFPGNFAERTGIQVQSSS